MVKNLPAMQETQVQFLGWEYPLEMRMATQSSILVWKILWKEEPGELQFMGSQRLGHDWAIKTQASFNIWFQFSSVTQLCLTLWDPMNRKTPCFPVHHQVLEFTQTHVHWIGDAIQLSHPLPSPYPPVLNRSQHQDLFTRVSSSHQVAKILEFQLQHQSFQWTSRTDFL